MTFFYEHLESLGFTETFVRKEVIPDWWEDEIALNPAGYSELVGITCRKLKLKDVRAFYENN